MPARWTCLTALALLATPLLAQSKSLLIEDLTWTEVRDAIAAGKTTALYYAGSIEQNGPGMALGKHLFLAHYISQRIAEQLGGMLQRIKDNTISGKIAKDLFDIVWNESGDPRAIVEQRAKAGGLRCCAGQLGAVQWSRAAAGPGTTPRRAAGSAGEPVRTRGR